jgi:threonyl-tRNA synthetase
LHAGVRSELDERSDTLGFKIREAELHRVPVMLVVGDQEEAAGSVMPRFRHRPAAEGGAMALDALVAELVRDIKERRSTRQN